MFLEMWNYINKDNAVHDEFLNPHNTFSQSEESGFVQPFCDSPLEHDDVGENLYVSIISSVIYLILTAGLKMLKSIDKNTLNLTLLTLVMASMLCCSITAVSFSSVFYILICGAVGLVVFFLRKIRKGDGKTS